MNVIDFFEYLAAHEHTAELASVLATIWTDRVIAEMEFAAA